MFCVEWFGLQTLYSTTSCLSSNRETVLPSTAAHAFYRHRGGRVLPWVPRRRRHLQSFNKNPEQSAASSLPAQTLQRTGKAPPFSAVSQFSQGPKKSLRPWSPATIGLGRLVSSPVAFPGDIMSMSEEPPSPPPAVPSPECRHDACSRSMEGVAGTAVTETYEHRKRERTTTAGWGGGDGVG